MQDAEETTSVDAFFRSYLDAFERLDVEALSERLAYPCHMAGEGGSLTVMATPADYAAGVAPLIRAYRALGVVRGTIRDSSILSLAPDLAQVRIEWDARDAGGGVIYEHQAVYTLVRRSGAWAIAALAFNEMSRLRACLAAAHN